MNRSSTSTSSKIRSLPVIGCKSLLASLVVALALAVTVSICSPQYWEIDNHAYHRETIYSSTSQMSVSVASNRFSDLGEGPFWDPLSQSLLYVDAFVGDVCRLDPQTGETETIHFEKLVTFVIPYSTNPNKMVISVGNEVRELEWRTRSSNLLVIPDPDVEGNRFNDAKVDYYGRLWAGTLNGDVKESGYLYRIDTDFQYQRFAEKLTVSNGITWTLDNRRMFFIDSDPRRIYQFDYDVVNGEASNQRLLVDFDENSAFHDYGHPDGMTIDEENKLWVACFGAGRVVRIDPDTTEILQTIYLPVSKVTSVTFGGPHYDELYITTAKRDLTPEQLANEPLAGAVFKATGLGVRGRPAFKFGL